MAAHHMPKDSAQAAPKRQPAAQPASAGQLVSEAPAPELSAASVMRLQRTIGNHAVQRMLAASSGGIQRDTAPTQELSEDQVNTAVRYNRSRHFSVEIIQQIQRAVGVNDDGVIGAGTVRAIAAWQSSQGMTVDGKVGPATLPRLVPEQEAALPAPAQAAVEAEQTQSENTPEPEEGGLIHSVVSGMGDMWDSVKEGAANMWDGITGYFGDDNETAPPAETPAEDTAPPAPEPSELDQLMLKERLSPEEILRARELIALVTDTTARADLYHALQSKPEYRSQRDNESKNASGGSIGDVMCNLTSLAMALSYLGIPNPDPTKQYEDALEDIRVEKNLPARTTSAGWGGVAAELGVTANFLGYDLIKDKDWYMANVLPKLRDGFAVMMSISGHIVRMQDVTENGLVIDDPFGVVNLQAGEGWSYDSDNKNAKEGEGTNKGEDSVWAWSAVSVHNMRWIAALK
ncbi:MAG: peptidoglycan-binding protein [Pleurocapsa minor GSE-CHR-MK-17-07R]|nr:peptidoglycan-binding protein [Pleurocapsa minor GSE-CHR-MK 17-07R]